MAEPAFRVLIGAGGKGVRAGHAGAGEAAHDRLHAIADQPPPSLRLTNLMFLGHNMSVDLYVDSVVSRAKLVIVRLLGGRGYWTYGVDQVAGACREAGIPVAFLPGDDQPDADLMGCSTLEQGAVHRIWQYLVHGGPGNAANLLAYGAALLGHDRGWAEPAELLRAGYYLPKTAAAKVSQTAKAAPRLSTTPPVCASRA